MLMVCIFCTKNLSGQTFNNFNLNVGDFSGLGNLVKLGTVVGASLLVLSGNEAHISYNFSKPATPFGHSISGGNGFSIEISNAFTVKDRIIYGFQRNYFTRTITSSESIDLRYEYYHIGYIRDLGKSNKKTWKPYLGGDFIYSDQKAVLGLLIGSRVSIVDRFDLENRITISKKSMNAQLGISFRYRKGTWHDVFKSK